MIRKTSQNAAADLFRSESRRGDGIFFRQTLWLVQEALVFGDVEKLLCERRGFTRGAGFCLAATALRNGRRVIAVTMGSPDSKTRDIKIAELLERGFAKQPPAPLFQPAADSPLEPAPRNATPPPTTVKPAPKADPTSETTVKFSIPGKR